MVDGTKIQVLQKSTLTSNATKKPCSKLSPKVGKILQDSFCSDFVHTERKKRFSEVLGDQLVDFFSVNDLVLVDTPPCGHDKPNFASVFLKEL